MNYDAFRLQILQNRLKYYVRHEFPKRAGQISVRFVNGNFRAQGWQGGSFSKWPANARKGTVLVKTGRLRRGTNFREGIAAVTVYNNVPYAAAHNLGFRGTVQVKQHTRRRFTKERVATGGLTQSGRPKMKTISRQASVSVVKAHTRNMRLPRRQFMPTSATDSPVLVNALIREIERSLKTFFPN
jgi:phage gpG-like protein